MNDKSVIWHHVAVAAVLVITKMGGDLLPRRPPVVSIQSMPFPNPLDHRSDERVCRDDRQAGIDQLLDIGFNEGLRFHGCQHLRAVNGHAVVGDTGRPPRQIGGKLRVAGRHHGPTVDEDLGANLLGHHLAIQRHRAAAGCGDALLQAQKGSVLSGVAHTAPPKDRALFDNVVQPTLPDLRRRYRTAVAVVGQCAQKCKRAGNIIVGDNQGHVQMLVDIIVDLAEMFTEHLVGPALERPAQVDADQLAQHAGVDSFSVVARNCHLVAP